jgi:hypothetical protein
MKFVRLGRHFLQGLPCIELLVPLHFFTYLATDFHIFWLIFAVLNAPTLSDYKESVQSTSSICACTAVHRVTSLYCVD